MSLLSPFCSTPYNEFHAFDTSFFNHNKVVKSAYDKAPITSRGGSLPVMACWSVVRVAVSPLIDLVCLAVFPILLVMKMDQKYFWGCVNALVGLGVTGGLITLTILSVGTGMQGWMFSITISHVASQVFLRVVYYSYIGLRGPLHPQDKRGPASTLFHRFNICEPFRLHPKQNPKIEEIMRDDGSGDTIWDKISKIFNRL